MREPVPTAPDGQPLLSDLLLADRGVILYLDTSALAKLFITEPGSDLVAGAVCSFLAMATHHIEMHATLAKAVRMGWVVAYSLELRLQDFKDRWASLDVVDTTDDLVRRDWILFFDEADALFGKRSGPARGLTVHRSV